MRKPITAVLLCKKLSSFILLFSLIACLLIFVFSFMFSHSLLGFSCNSDTGVHNAVKHIHDKVDNDIH